MSFALKLVLAAMLLAVPTLGVGYVFYESALSSHDWIYQGGGQWSDGGIHAAPGPLAGAGLPVIVIAGGALWLVRRSRRKTN